MTFDLNIGVKYLTIKHMVKDIKSKPQKVLKVISIFLKSGPKGLNKKFREFEARVNSEHETAVLQDAWLETLYSSGEELQTPREKSSEFVYQPKISLITPTFNTPIKYLKDCIQSVIEQTYLNWELCLADDASTNPSVRKCLDEFAKSDKRIKLVYRKENGNISKASNSALKIASGEYVGLLDHDDVLLPNALFEVIKLLNSNPEADFIYSDEDKITEDGNIHLNHFFKPDWSPDLLFSVMYTGHFTVYRKKLVDEVGGFDSSVDYSQDYDLALKISEKTKNILHIPKVLYSWRMLKVSGAAGGKPYARKSNLQALANAMSRRGLRGEVLEYPFANKFQYDLDQSKKVSIIIPSDNYENCVKVIESINRNTSYGNYEILLVIREEIGNKVKDYFKQKNIKVVGFEREFNFSAKCNEGAKHSSSEFLIFLNDDIEVLNHDWVERLIEFFQRKEVGAVSPKLVYENGTIQYSGMFTGTRGMIDTTFHTWPGKSTNYFNFVLSCRNVSLMSGACFAIRKSTFAAVGGFDEINTPIMHSDADLSFRLRKFGYLLVYTPFTTLKHIGHHSLKSFEFEKVKANQKPGLYLLRKYSDMISYDPYFPDNLRTFLQPNGFFKFKIFPFGKGDDLKPKKSLLLISHDLSLSGAPILLYELSKELKKNDYYIVVVSAKDGELSNYYKQAGINVIIDELIARAPQYEMKNFFSEFDLILANTIICWQLIYVAKEINVPVIWLIHESKVGEDICKSSPVIAKAFSIADKVVFAAKTSKTIYSKYLKSNYEIVYAGIDDGNLAVKINKKLGKSLELTVIQMGSFEKRKGQDILIKAVESLPKTILGKIRIYLIGRVLDKHYFTKLKRVTEKLPNVEIINQVPYSEIDNYYKTADIFVCSSRDETVPLTLLDAMKYEIAIISTKVGGITEIIKDKKSGLLVESEDYLSLGKAITKLVEDPDFRNKLVTQAKIDFFKNYTLKKYSENINKVIKGVIK